jgi:uncharacterized protein
MTTTTEIRKPEPVPSADTLEFWQGARDNTFLLQACDACGKVSFYPRKRCPHCWSDALVSRAASGDGVIASYTIVHRPGHPSFAEDGPYVIALIDLAEGPRILSSIVDCPVDAVSVGAPVRIQWTAQGRFNLAKFRLIGQAA